MSSVELKNFQWATVAATLKGLEAGGGVFAISDEVGLGKTLVCAEIAHQLIASSRKDTHLFYYVAPSIELLHQNLASIRRYVQGRARGRADVRNAVSRLSQVPRDLGTERGRVDVIGLSPGTSFRVAGAGEKTERAYLAALFAFGRHEPTKEKVAEFFWCLDRKVDSYFIKKIADFSVKIDRLKPYLNTDEQQGLLAALIEAVDARHPLGERRHLVGKIRQSVARFLIQRVRPDLVIFDEWHKYKQTCLENELLETFLSRYRQLGSSRVLLVSATPFAVDYKERGGDARLQQGDDLKGLLQMRWGKGEFEAHYERLWQLQARYVDSVRDAIEDPERGGEARASKEAYEHELRKYSTRTERPKGALSGEAVAKDLGGDWDPVFEGQSMAHFHSRFREASQVRSPVTAMWLDGNAFPAFGYEGLKKALKNRSNKPLPGSHWKISRLIKLLRGAFQFTDAMHSFACPPLWLGPGETADRKHLIFTEFMFVPNEICHSLAERAGFGQVGKKVKGSVLGYFPLKKGKGKAPTESARNTMHFLLFYPFFAFELPEKERTKRVEEHRAAIDKIIESAREPLEMALAIDEMFCETDLQISRLKYRKSALRATESGAVSKRAREYLRFLFYRKEGAEYSIGALLARLSSQLLAQMALAASAKEEWRRLSDFEQSTIRLAGAVLRLFASPEAQRLKTRARPALPRYINRKWNSYARFAMWYSRKFELERTLEVAFTLSAQSGVAPEAVQEELEAAISLRRGSAGNRFVRSFHDRRLGDLSDQDDSESAITVRSLRAAFNSPFPPYVLASTSVGQEGLDFHRYCTSVIHWSPPTSPNVLRQREGRLDRYRSLQIRRALNALDADAKAQVRTLDEISPDFVVISNGKRINYVDRHVWYLPFTAQEAAWNRCLQRMYYNDLLIGAPDPLSDERRLLGALERDPAQRAARFKTLQSYAISLKPKDPSARELEELKGC